MRTRSDFEKKSIVYAVILILMLIAFLLSISVGKYRIALKEILYIVSGSPVDQITKNVFLTLRLPRSIMALTAGLGLGVAGSVFQTVFKNPLASPDIIGVSSGANIGAAFSIVFLSGGTIVVAFCAFAGGMLAVLAVLGLVRIAGNRGVTTFVLAGIAMNALAQALVMAMKLLADPERQLPAIEFWTMGGLGSITNDKLYAVLPVVLAGLLGLVLLRWQIVLLSLSDSEGKALGMRVGYARCCVLLFTTLVVAGIVCVTGQIAFIGLIAPHIARLILNKIDHCLSGLIGAVILLAADCLSRTVSAGEIPISILTSLIGVPFLIYLMCRRGTGIYDGQ